jgi:hypothetical protein
MSGIRAAPAQPVFVRKLGKCVFCGYPLVENFWPTEGTKIDHDLPKADFPTLQSAIEFMRRHP